MSQDDKKKWAMVDYLGSKEEPAHYVDMTKDLKRLRADIFPFDYTSKNTASILSSEITRNPNNPFKRVGKGYYTVTDTYKKKKG